MKQIQKNEYITQAVEETMDLASGFARTLSPGDIVCLKGDLGAGKTYFTKGVARELGIDPERVQSPTFTLVNEYRGSKMPLYHFDWYRIDSPEEALEIGVEEYFYNMGVSVIEWPEKIMSLIPEQAVWIEIESVNSTTRKIKFAKHSEKYEF